jgi:hypothetical protein
MDSETPACGGVQIGQWRLLLARFDVARIRAPHFKCGATIPRKVTTIGMADQLRIWGSEGRIFPGAPMPERAIVTRRGSGGAGSTPRKSGLGPGANVFVRPSLCENETLSGVRQEADKE